VSSPPYLNQVSYAESTRLELAFAGIATTWRGLATVSARMVASSTQQVTIRRAAEARTKLEEFPGTAKTVAVLADRLQHVRRTRVRGKAYDVLVPVYFHDMGLVLANLLVALSPGARAAWVVGDSAPYGVYIDTPAILALLASELGFRVVDDVPLRARPTRWPAVNGRCTRVLSERLLVIERPLWGVQGQLPGFE
jgi:hypothetical protein